MPRKITEGIYWVGAKDFALRDFHSYETTLGTTYNAYLVQGNRAALVDTVKASHQDQLLRRLEALLPLQELDYIVVNHCELDHMGSLEAVAKLAPRAKIVVNSRGKDGVLGHFPALSSRDFVVVKTGDTLDLGELSLAFYQVPMVHWPESMATYVPERKTLFSNDAFGQHYASEHLLDTEAPEGLVLRELQKYYASIVDLLNPGPVRKALEAVKSLSPEILAPSHGVVWTRLVDKVLSLYEEWSSGKTRARATLIYDTMYGSTGAMARVIEEGFEAEGVPLSVYRASVSDFQEVLADTMVSGGIIVGGPTMNNALYPPVSFFLEYLRQASKRPRKGFAFGSYGWGGGGERDILSYFERCGIVVDQEPWRVKFRPTPEDLSLGHERAKAFARSLLEDS